MNTRIDHLTGGIYPIASWMPEAGISFNQFLIDDEQPALIHTGEHGMYEAVRRAVTEVLDPARLLGSAECRVAFRRAGAQHSQLCTLR